MGGKNVRKSQNGLQAAVLLPSECTNAGGSWSPEQCVRIILDSWVTLRLDTIAQQSSALCLVFVMQIALKSTQQGEKPRRNGEKPQRNGETKIVKVLAKKALGFD